MRISGLPIKAVADTLQRQAEWLAAAAVERRAYLQEGWVIANHILVSFHVAFISSVLTISGEVSSRSEVLRLSLIHI